MKTEVLEHLSSKVKIKLGLKQTEIGSLPEDWVVVELGNLIAKNPDYGINAPAVDFDFNLPTYLRITDISEDGRFIAQHKMSVDNSLSKNYYLESGDLVIARTGASVGKSYLYDEKDGLLVFAGFLIRFKPNKEKLNSVFFKYLTQTKNYWNWVVANSMRSGQPGLNSNEFKKYSFGLPPTIHEQTAIAIALSDADALIWSLEQLIEKKKNIKQGAMQELLTGKRRLNGFDNNLGYKQTEVGMIPADWELKTYDEIFLFLKTATYSRAELSDNEDVKYLHYGDIHTKWNLHLNFESAELPSITSSKVCGYNLLQDGDVIMADASEDYHGIGKSVEVLNIKRTKSISGLHTFLLRDKNKIFVDGFRGYLHVNAIVKNQFDRLATGMKVYGVSKFNLKRVQVPVPNHLEQIAISNALNEMEREFLQLESKLEKHRRIKQGMMQNLLTGKIRLI